MSRVHEAASLYDKRNRVSRTPPTDSGGHCQPLGGGGAGNKRSGWDHLREVYSQGYPERVVVTFSLPNPEKEPSPLRVPTTQVPPAPWITTPSKPSAGPGGST